LEFPADLGLDHKGTPDDDESVAKRFSGNLILAQELVLNLHGIGTPHDNVSSGELFFWVSRRAFTTLLESIVATRAIAQFPAVITFDDGNASDALIALPELLKRGLKASFFVCAGRIGAPHYLDRLALADLIAEGMEIGTHGKDHRDWRGLDETTLDAELGDARRRIEDVCGIAVTKAAIPFGSYDRRLLRRLSRERFECVYTSDRGLAQSEAWLKPRDTMDSSWQEADIKQVLTVKPSLKARLRRKTAMLYKRLR
jgi:peptidoglycan/xylan/chitin deacetylase (PgdA/CDA1 family)